MSIFGTKSKKKNAPAKIPVTAAESIPYKYVYQNGLIEIKQGYFSKSWSIPGTNFKIASQQTQGHIAELWGIFLGKFDPDMDVQLTLYNKTIDIVEFRDKVLLDAKADNFNEFRDEYNNMLLEKMTMAKNNLHTEKYLTVSLPAENVKDAEKRFLAIDEFVVEDISMITKADPKPLSIEDRLEILNSIYHQDDAVPLIRKKVVDGKEVVSFSLENCERQGITTKDVIAPTPFSFSNPNGAVIGNTLAKSYYVANYPTWIKGSMLTDFTNMPCNIIVSCHFRTMSQQAALDMMKRQSTNISSALVEIQKRASRSGYDASLISPEKPEARQEVDELREQMTKDNSRIIMTTLTFTLFAPTLEKLNEYETYLKAKANSNLMTVRPLGNMNEQGFNLSLPLANDILDLSRLMTTESVSSMVPFDTKEISQEHGRYCGVNAATKDLILYDRSSNLNPCGIILGMPGAGKSFRAKEEIVNTLLDSPNDSIFVIDPEGEYKKLAEAFNGSSIKLAAGSKTFINPFDLHLGDSYEGEDPVKKKCNFIQAICESMLASRYGLSPAEKSIIDTCVMEIYRPYVEYLKRTGKQIDVDRAPTIKNFYEALINHQHYAAKEMATSLLRYVSGSADLFANRTNVNIDNRFTVYDIKDIGGDLKELGLQICFDNIWTHMIQNWEKGRPTWIYIDEFYLMMQKPTSAEYISQIWKRARKWNGRPMAMTQNVEDMLKSEQARTVINNCTYKVLLTQSPINKQQLAQILNLSPEEQRYMATGEPGKGLIMVGDDAIPFIDKFPSDTKLYKIMTTKPDEVLDI